MEDRCNILLNAKKSKCLVMFSCGQQNLWDHLSHDCTFYIGGSPIEFMEPFSHLGHTITNDLDDSVIGDISRSYAYT